VAANTLGITLGGVLALSYAPTADARNTSGGEYSNTLTNYYEGAGHNKILLRGGRGTSAAADYLSDNDTLGTLKFEARDGAATWGDGAEVKVTAGAAHTSGSTESRLDIYATGNGTDTQTHVAGFLVERLLPGVLDLDISMLDSRGVSPSTLGADWLFGYAGDITSPVDLSAYTGIVVLERSTGDILFMLGLDNRIYFGDGSNQNPLDDDSFRAGGDGSGGFSIEQYDSTGDTWTPSLTVTPDGIEVGAAMAVCYGDASTDGSWRTIRDGNNLVTQRRESGTWTTKQTITP